MWPILLKVLSIIGIVLACIIGLILLIILVLLFCPITYKLDGNAHEEKYSFKLKIKYLFGIIRAGYEYPEPGVLYAKALWIDLYRFPEKEDGNVKKSKNSTKVNNVKKDASSSEKKNFDSKSNNLQKEVKKKKNKEEKRRILNPIYYIKKKWYEFYHKVIDFLKLKYKDFTFYKKLIEHEDTGILFAKFKKTLIKFLKVIAPKKGTGNVIIGMDSPDTTALIYGAYCVTLNKLRNQIVMIPDFENKQIEGYVKISGWFNLFSVAVSVLPFVLSKDLRLAKARIDMHQSNMEKASRKFDRKFEENIKANENEYAV